MAVLQPDCLHHSQLLRTAEFEVLTGVSGPEIRGDSWLVRQDMALNCLVKRSAPSHIVTNTRIHWIRLQ